MTDIEKLKEELKAEILEELKAENSKKSVPGLEVIRKKWFNGPDSRNKYSSSLMHQMFGNDQHRIWDNVRSLARIIFGMKSQVRLSSVDQKELEMVCESLCELIYKLKEELNKEESI